MHTDPIADMLTRIRNAGRAKHKKVDIPLSRPKLEIARLLQENNYVANYKDPHTRVESLTFKSLRPNDARAEPTWALICGADISDVIDLDSGNGCHSRGCAPCGGSIPGG